LRRMRGDLVKRGRKDPNNFKEREGFFREKKKGAIQRENFTGGKSTIVAEGGRV